MTKGKTAALISAGMATGVLAAVLFGGHAGTPVQAQPAASTAASRYQISAYGLSSSGAESRSVRGAYILDTQTGEVFEVVASGAPTLIGSVAKAKK